MPRITETLASEHRTLDALIDELHAAIETPARLPEAFERAAQFAAGHYSREERFVTVLRRHDQAMAGKMTAQHAEAMEIFAALRETLAEGASSDVVYLARRFCAIARHNLIEEERDVFPAADRCFSEAEQQSTGADAE